MATSKEPIRQLLSRPDIKKMSKNLPNEFLTSAQHQYQHLLEYLRKLKQDYPEKAKMLERREKSSRTKKADSSTAFTKDKEISALYCVLKMTESKEEEWDEFYYLLDARYFLNEAYGHDAKTFSTSCDRQTKGAVLGSGNNPTHQNMGGRPASQSYTQVDGHGAIASPTSSDRQTIGIVLGSENSPTYQNIGGRPASQSFTQGMAIGSDMSKNISDPRKTYHVCSVEPGRQKPEQPTKTGKSEIQPTVKAGKPERQQTDSTTGDIVNAEREVERPISLLLSTRRSKEAEKAYQKLLDNQNRRFKDRQILQTYKKLETSTDIEDITDEQRKQSPVLYDYLKDTFEKTKVKSQELVKRALYEFIILTSASYDPPADKKTKGASATASNFPKKDVPCASVINVDKILKSEYANLKPIQKALHKIKLTCTDLTAAEHQYYQLFIRDENFKRRFPEQHRELQVLMRDPEECAITSHKALYSALRRLQKTDPLYREAWEEFFFLITSQQEFIIAERCDKVIPRKSYEDLQNELVEKNKQIDELTSRLRDNKTERADLNSKPLKNKRSDGML